MRRIWRFLPSVQHETQLLGVLPIAPWRAAAPGRPGSGRGAAAPAAGGNSGLHVDGFRPVAHAHQVFLFDARSPRRSAGAPRARPASAPAGRSSRCPAGRPAPGRAAAWPRSACRMLASSRQWLRGLHQHHGRLVPVLGLAADVAHRLVEQDGDLLRLLAARLGGRPRCARPAPPAAPITAGAPLTRTQPLRDPVVGLAARAAGRARPCACSAARWVCGAPWRRPAPGL